MGHVISMVNKIVELCSSTSLGQYLKDNLPDVSKYLEEFKESTLEETNKIQAMLLVSFTNRKYQRNDLSYIVNNME